MSECRLWLHSQQWRQNSADDCGESPGVRGAGSGFPTRHRLWWEAPSKWLLARGFSVSLVGHPKAAWRSSRHALPEQVTHKSMAEHSVLGDWRQQSWQHLPGRCGPPRPAVMSPGRGLPKGQLRWPLGAPQGLASVAGGFPMWVPIGPAWLPCPRGGKCCISSLVWPALQEPTPGAQ